MKTFVIVNPEAGGRAGRRLWPRVRSLLKNRLGPVDFAETKSSGHARVLARDAALAGAPCVVAYGGDGTVHEVANGLYDSRDAKAKKAKPSLGIVNVGTGGDLIKTLGIPNDLQRQIEIIAGPSVRSIDLGSVEYVNDKGEKERRIFINIADAGLGAEVVRELHQTRNLFGRKLAYISSTLKAFAQWREKEIRISADRNGVTDVFYPQHDWPMSPLSVVVANGRFFGGGMPIAPSAVPDDGYFDLVVIGSMGPLKALAAIPLLYMRQLIRLPGVYCDRVRTVTLESDSPTLKDRVGLDIDGEPIGFLPARFEIIPKAMQVKCPESA